MSVKRLLKIIFGNKRYSKTEFTGVNEKFEQIFSEPSGVKAQALAEV
jgi:hypothetical protein